MTSHSLHSRFSIDGFTHEIIPKRITKTLVIGEITRWISQGRHVPQMKGFTFLEFDAITTEVMRTINPEVVLSPLVCDDFDATQMIAELARYNFKGRYRAVTSGLTNPQMVLREVRTFAPAVDFDLLVIPEDGSLSIMQ